jgi:hypothetical protein
MDATKLHLIFNYSPLIGTPIGIIVLLYGNQKLSVRAQNIGLGVLVLTAILTLVVFGTGEAAGMGSEFIIGPVWTNIQQHKVSAFPSFAVVESMGVFALFGMINLIRGKALAKWFAIMIVILSITAIGLTARTAYFGKQIHSLEVSAAQ